MKSIRSKTKIRRKGVLAAVIITVSAAIISLCGTTVMNFILEYTGNAVISLGVPVAEYYENAENIQDENLVDNLIDEVYPVLILTLLVNTRTSDEGEEIRGIHFLIFIHQFLHTGFPMDSDLLSRLLTKIDKIVALQVGLLQIGDVYQRHATGVETIEEDVAR